MLGNNQPIIMLRTDSAELPRKFAKLQISGSHIRRTKCNFQEFNLKFCTFLNQSRAPSKCKFND